MSSATMKPVMTKGVRTRERPSMGTPSWCWGKEWRAYGQTLQRTANDRCWKRCTLDNGNKKTNTSTDLIRKQIRIQYGSGTGYASGRDPSPIPASCEAAIRLITWGNIAWLQAIGIRVYIMVQINSKQPKWIAFQSKAYIDKWWRLSWLFTALLEWDFQWWTKLVYQDLQQSGLKATNEGLTRLVW